MSVQERIRWKDAEIKASGWTDQQVAQAQETAMRKAYDKFVAAGKDTLYLQDMDESYSNGNGSVFRSYKVTSYSSFVEAFSDSGEPFTRYINRMGKYWYGQSFVWLFLPA